MAGIVKTVYVAAAPAAAVTVNESVVRSAADKLVSLGLVQHGYTYLNLDGGWVGGLCVTGISFSFSCSCFFMCQATQHEAEHARRQG